MILRWRLAPLVLLAAALAGCDRGADAPAPRSVAVRTAIVHAAPYAPTQSITGEIRARTQSDLSFKLGGRMIERLVNVGDHVAKDQLLARIDPTQQQADVASAEASLAAAQAQARQATSALQRQQALLERGFTTRSDYDRAVATARTNDNAIESARAALAIAKSALADTELRADAAGIVIARNADVGEVTQAARAIFTIARDGPRDVLLDVDETTILNELETDQIQLQLVGNPAVTALARVREISPSINTATGTIRVKAGIEAPPAAMTLGALVVASGRFKPQPAIAIPWTALTGDRGQPAVWVVDAATRAVALKRVDILAYETGAVQIGGGLAEGERVVVEGGKFLVPGQTITELDGARS